MSGGRFNLADYVTVDERIDKFWADHHGDGSIQTEVCWVADDGGSVAIRASVYLGPRLVATGIAQEERGNGGANKTSWWENAETSAIGRALANYGMSLSKQRPSREEMEKVERYDERPARTPAPPRAQTGGQTLPAAPGTLVHAAPVSAPLAPEKPAPKTDDDLLAIVNDDTRIPERRVKAGRAYVAVAVKDKDEAGVIERVGKLTSLPKEEREAIRTAALAYLRGQGDTPKPFASIAG